MLVPIGVSIGVLMYTNTLGGNGIARYDRSIEELSVAENAAEGIYDVERIREYRSVLLDDGN